MAGSRRRDPPLRAQTTLRVVPKVVVTANGGGLWSQNGLRKDDPAHA